MSNSQIVSLWVGTNAQHYAHHFYNLQAEQFFDQSEDPANHQVLWKDQQKKVPRALIFDVQIENLNRLRATDRKKMIRKIQKMQTVQFGEGTDYMSLLGVNNQFKFANNIDPSEATKKSGEEQGKISPIFENWLAEQKNYMLINKQFHVGKETFAIWQGLYNREAQSYDDRIRKELQNTDYLRGFTVCSDDNRAGFTHRLLQNLRDQCPKTNIMYIGFRANEQQTNNISLVSSIAQIVQKVDMYIPFQQLVPQNPYFKVDPNFYKQERQFAFVNHLSPLLSNIFTPLCLSNNTMDNYFSQIIPHNQNIFNVCYTLPYIYAQPQNNKFDEDQEEEKRSFERMTNIFRYANQSREHEEEATLMNFTNKNNAFDLNTKSGKFISESYVLKGHGLKLQKQFKPKTQLLSVKYLKGIISGPQAQVWPQIQYDGIYNKNMGKQVSHYPFYSVMFSHQCFGEGIRKLAYTPELQKKHKQQMIEFGWRQKLFEIGDKYYEDKKNDEQDD